MIPCKRFSANTGSKNICVQETHQRWSQSLKTLHWHFDFILKRYSMHYVKEALIIWLQNKYKTMYIGCRCFNVSRSNAGATRQASVLLTVRILWCVFESCSDSQFQNKHHVCAVLVHIVQCYDVGVLELLQDAHFPLDLLSSYTSSAGPTLALLDELGCIFSACALLYAALDYCKLPTADTKEKKTLTLLNASITVLFCFIWKMVKIHYYPFFVLSFVC